MTRMTPLERIRVRFPPAGVGSPGTAAPAAPSLGKASELSADAREFLEERAAVAEHDGGLSPEDALRQAWCELRADARFRDHGGASP